MYSVSIFKGAVQQVSYDAGFWSRLTWHQTRGFGLSTWKMIIARTRIRDLWGDDVSVSSLVAAFLRSTNCRFKILRECQEKAGVVKYNLFLGPITYITQACSMSCKLNPNGDTSIKPPDMFDLDVTGTYNCSHDKHDQWTICTTVKTIQIGELFSTDSVHPGPGPSQGPGQSNCGICDFRY